MFKILILYIIYQLLFVMQIFQYSGFLPVFFNNRALLFYTEPEMSPLSCIYSILNNLLYAYIFLLAINYFLKPNKEIYKTFWKTYKFKKIKVSIDSDLLLTILAIPILIIVPVILFNYIKPIRAGYCAVDLLCGPERLISYFGDGAGNVNPWSILLLPLLLFFQPIAIACKIIFILPILLYILNKINVLKSFKICGYDIHFNLKALIASYFFIFLLPDLVAISISIIIVLALFAIKSKINYKYKIKPIINTDNLDKFSKFKINFKNVMNLQYDVIVVCLCFSFYEIGNFFTANILNYYKMTNTYSVVVQNASDRKIVGGNISFVEKYILPELKPGQEAEFIFDTKCQNTDYLKINVIFDNKLQVNSKFNILDSFRYYWATLDNKGKLDFFNKVIIIKNNEIYAKPQSRDYKYGTPNCPAQLFIKR